MKLRKKIKLSTIIKIIIISILFLTFLIINNFSKNISPRLIKIAESQIKKDSTDMIVKSFNKEIIDKYDLNKIIILNKNKDDEIITIDFDMNNTYKIALDVVKNIREKLTTYENGYIIYLPIGIGTNSVYFSNLGPKVPVKINFIDTLSTSLYTKVKSYGINNSLIEVYMKVNLKEEILIPFDSKITNIDCDILLSSQIIEGKIPDIYNGLLEKNSSLINMPITQ